MSNKLTETVQKIKYLKGWTVEEVAQSIGYSRVHITKQTSKKEDDEITEQLNALLKEKHKDALQNDSPGTIAEEPEVAYSNRDLKSLIESNKLLAEAQKGLSDAHLVLANTLSVMMSKSTVGELEDILGGMNATMNGLADVLTDVAAGKRYPSKLDADGAIRKKTAEHLPKAKPVGKLTSVRR